MVYQHLLRSFKPDRLRQGFIYPRYGALSIAEIVPTVYQLFNLHRDRAPLPFVRTMRPQKRIVIVIIDGLSYHQFLDAAEYPFFHHLLHYGEVYPITSVFPSTTAAALTTLHTGYTPQEHGLPEWYVYFQEFDESIETLPFKTWDMSQRDGLLQKGGTASMLYDGETAYEVLKEQGIPSYIFMQAEHIQSAYSESVHRGAIKISYRDGQQLTENFMPLLANDSSGYYVVYWGKVDSVAHTFGPRSHEHREALGEVTELFSELFLKKRQTNPTFLMMVADHGQTSIEGEDIIYLNQFSELKNNYCTTKQGEPILPTGSPHDIFLHIKPDKIDGTVDILRRLLVGKAEVVTTAEALQRGLFGLNQPTQRFLNRIGTVLILPHSGNHIWYNFFPHQPYGLKGVHGGLSAEEMIVPLAMVSL